MLIFSGTRGVPGCHIDRVTAQHTQETGEFLNLSEGVLCPNFRHRSLKINVKQILEVFGGSFALIINHANWTATVRPGLDLRQANVPKRESGKNFKKN